MAEKTLKSRIVNKHDTETNWLKATGFVPKQGEIIIYDKDDTYNYERIKIGDGTTLVSGLPFANDNKVDKISGKGLSTNDYTDEEKNKLATLDTLVGDTSVSEQISTAITSIPVVDNYKNGLMTSTDKKKLDTIESNAQKNVQSDWTLNDMSSMSFVQNRPFYEGPLSITWDGVTKGHTTYPYNSSNYLVKISDKTFTDEELQAAKFVISENGATTEVVVANVWADRVTTDKLTGVWYNDRPCVYVSRGAGALVGPGTYFLYNYSSNIFIKSFTVGADDYVKKIDDKFIPDSVVKQATLESYEFITIADIDEICGGSIITASEVTY